MEQDASISKRISAKANVKQGKHRFSIISRCLYPKNDFEYSQGPWKKIGEEVDCDVMEVNCTRPNSTFFYNTLHTQIHRQL